MDKREKGYVVCVEALEKEKVSGSKSANIKNKY
jgi:hypothetical protein